MKINMHQRQSVSMNTVPGSTASYVKKSISEHNADSEAHKELFDSKANKDSLSAVATSGNYNDLTDIPIINLDIANESELDNLNHEELSLGAGDCVFYKGKYFGNPYLLLVQVVYGPGETEWPDTIIDDGVRTFQFMWASNYPHANIKACYKSRVYKHDYSTDEGVWSNWSEYLTSDDVVDNLASSESKKALSAKQGKVLSDRIGDIETALDNIIAIQNTLIGGESV